MAPTKRTQAKDRRSVKAPAAKTVAPREAAVAKPSALRETPARKTPAPRENQDGGRRLPDVERDDLGVEGGLAQAAELRAGARSASTRGKYVYCVIQATEALKFGAVGLGAEPAEVHTVHYKDIAAVASDTPIEVPDATRENVLAHERVNENVMRSHTVIPMSFGTVFKTREDIVELLRGAYDAFHDVLVKMQDKLEFGLKLLWDRDVAIREVEKDDEEVRRLKSEISSQKGSTYFARMQ
ncbi:MAG: GvpL/GvpF family gas vesicle protein, partial [Candidatus Rokuibacteriota bacterium]